MKYSLLIVMALLVFYGCSDSQINSLDNDREKVKLVKAYFDSFNQHNWKKMAGFYADSAAFKDPSLGIEIVKQSKSQIIQKYSEMQQIFPDLRDSIITIYPSGDKHVVVEFETRGAARDHTRFKLPICTIFTIENNLITQDFTYYDN